MVERAHLELVGFESPCQGKLRPSAEIDIYPIPMLTVKIQKYDSGLFPVKVSCPKPNWKIEFDGFRTKFSAKINVQKLTKIRSTNFSLI